MAITCEPTITVLNVAERKVKVECRVVVDVNHIYTTTVQEADISTPTKKVEIANTIWSKLLVLHQKRLLEDAVAEEIETLGVALKENIEGRVI